MKFFENVQVKHAAVAISTTVSTILLVKAFQNRSVVMDKLSNLVKYICFVGPGDAIDSTPPCDCHWNSNSNPEFAHYDFGLYCHNLSDLYFEYQMHQLYCYHNYAWHYLWWYNRIHHNHKATQLKRQCCCHCRCGRSSNIFNENFKHNVRFLNTPLLMLSVDYRFDFGLFGIQ